jgi:hypothetical protein
MSQNQTPKQPAVAYPGEFTFGVATVSGAGKEYFTGFVLIPDAEGNKQSYKCMSFRSAVFNQAKHLGAVGDNKAVLKGQPVVLMGTFKQNTFQNSKDFGKWELLFDSMELQNEQYKPISQWFNAPENQQPEQR